MKRAVCTIAVLAALAGPAAAPAGQVTSPEQTRPFSAERPDERTVARLWGVLTYRRLSVQFAGTPAREAIETIRAALDIPLAARFADDALGYGIDPTSPITLEVNDQPAIVILEELLEQCAPPGECTWQIRGGYVEVGTRQRLGVPAARERRTYYIGDFLIDPTAEPDPEGRRKQPEFFALNLIEDVVENIEPEAWDYGQIDYDEDERRRLEDDRKLDPRTPGGSKGDRSAPAAAEAIPQYVQPIKMASIRYWRDLVIVDAPDFIHRQIDGYPDPIPPGDVRAAAPMGEEETAGQVVATLADARLTVDFEQAPVRVVCDAIAAALPHPLIVRYRQPGEPEGIDPEMPITLRVRDERVLSILDAFTAQLGTPERPVTWQTRRSCLEIGCKSRLGRRDCTTLRVYYVHDLLIGEQFAGRTHEEKADDLIRRVVESIEPGAWHVGTNEVADYGVSPSWSKRYQGGGRPPTAVPGRAMATIQYRGGGLVVRAPDFIHRQINGHLTPRAAASDE